MTRYIISLVCVLGLLSSSAWAQVRIINGDGATLEDLVREQALVTVVLKGGHPVTNLTLTGVNDTTISFTKSDGSNAPFVLSAVQSIRVQERRLVEKKSALSKGSLSSDEQAIVNQTLQRVTELFEAARDPQIRMAAASIAAAMGDEGALQYLQGHAQGNNVPIQIEASRYLWQAGYDIDPEVLGEGFISGNRDVRSWSAVLAGLVGDKSYMKEILEMSNNPSVEVYPSAIRSLARLGNRTTISKMYDGLVALKQPKSEAAVYALSELGGDDVIRTIKGRLNNADASEWFRLVRILYALNDDDGVELMRGEALDSFAHSKAAGLLLAEHDDWDGLIWVREHLDKQMDPSLPNLLYRAEIASAMYNTAQAQAKIELQQLIRMDNPSQIFAKGSNEEFRRQLLSIVHMRVCQILGEKGDKTNLSLLHSPMKSENPMVSLAASQAIAMTSNAQYRERVIELSDYVGEREMMLPEIFK